MKTKVLFVLQYPPPNHGASFVGEMIKDSSIINSEFNTSYVNSNLSYSTSRIGKIRIRKILVFSIIVSRVLFKLVFFKPDICYFSITAKGSGFFKDFLVGALLKLFSPKVVYHFHNKGVSKVQHHYYYDVCYNLLFRNSKVILLSERLYYDVSKYFNRDDTFICPNGIPVVGKMPSSSQGIRLLFLSNLFKSKGVYELLEACKILADRKVVFTCDFIGAEGDITWHDFESKVDELEINQYVTYHGKKYGADKDLFFQRASIFIHPTFEDCFPLVLLEALNFSLPVITTNVGAIEDIVIDNYNGYILKELTSDYLAKSILLLMLNPDKIKSMGLRSKELFEECYSKHIFEKNLKEIIKVI